MSLFGLVLKSSPTTFFLRDLGQVLPLVAPSLGAVARRCCAGVGGPSVRHVRSSWGALGVGRGSLPRRSVSFGLSARKTAVSDGRGR